MCVSCAVSLVTIGRSIDIVATRVLMHLNAHFVADARTQLYGVNLNTTMIQCKLHVTAGGDRIDIDRSTRQHVGLRTCT